MTIKIYVNHSEEEVVPEEIQRIRCSDAFNNWLMYENDFTYAEIFYLTKEEKEKMEQEYEEYLREKAIINLENGGWDQIELEV